MKEVGLFVGAHLPGCAQNWSHSSPTSPLLPSDAPERPREGPPGDTTDAPHMQETTKQRVRGDEGQVHEKQSAQSSPKRPASDSFFVALIWAFLLVELYAHPYLLRVLLPVLVGLVLYACLLDGTALALFLVKCRQRVYATFTNANTTCTQMKRVKALIFPSPIRSFCTLYAQLDHKVDSH